MNHKKTQLKTETISEQLQRKCDILPAAQHSAEPSLLTTPVQLHLSSGISALPLDIAGPPGTSVDPISLAQASSSVSDFDGLIHDTTPQILSNAIDVNPEYVDLHDGEYVHEDDNFPDEDALLDDTDLGDEGDNTMTLRPFVSVSDPTADIPDPFVVEARHRPGTGNLQELEIPTHLLVVYTMVSWLHLQFHLPRAACNAVLGFLALLFTFFKLAVVPPFITLQSSTRALGVDSRIELLAFCPECRGVYPSSGFRHMQEKCTLCHVPLFLSEHTRQGNHRAMKTPVIKYPYLPLSNQIASILKSPGLEALLDDWCTKPRKPGSYGDIFDGRMCRLKLRAPDGSLFFSNRPDEIKCHGRVVSRLVSRQRALQVLIG
jgi:hypothetical protein